MVFVSKTVKRGPAVYAGDGFFGFVKKAAKTVSKAVKSPVGKVMMKAYKKAAAPLVKQALTNAVGDKLADSIENVGKRTLDGEDIDKALVSEAKQAAINQITGGSTATRYRVSDIVKSIKATKRGATPRIQPSVVINRIVQEGNGGPIEANDVL